MNISPVSFTSYKNKINFGSQDPKYPASPIDEDKNSFSKYPIHPINEDKNDFPKYPTNPIIDDTKNRQNNSPDMAFDSALYTRGLVNRAFEALEEQGILETDENDIVHVSDDFDVFDDDMFNDPSKYAAKIGLATLNNVALMFGLPPEDERKDVPVFINFQFKNYINALIEQVKLLEQSQEEPVFDDLCTALDSNPDISEEQADSVKSMVYSGMQYMPEIIEGRKGMIEVLKTMPDEVQATLDNLSSALNYRFLKILQKGFEGDARAIINLLSQDNIAVNSEPIITPNNDGTTTYSYANLSGMLTVVRNSKNGDYISASHKAFGTNGGYSLQFNKDGSIKRLEYSNNVDNSVIVIEQNSRKKMTKVQQVFEGWASERNFIMTDDNLRQTSARVVLLNK